MKSPSRPAVGVIRDAIVRQKRHSPPIKLKEYNGTTFIETFFQQFRTCVAYYHLTEEDKDVYLRCQLTGDAANLLWAQPDADEIQFDELERMLRARFGSADQKEKFQTELGPHRRGREQSLQPLHADITRLMALAYPKDDSPLSSRIVRDYFLTALGDPKVEIKVREQEPSDLQDAYKTAIRLEMLKKASSARQAESTPAPMEVVKPSKATRAVQEIAEQMSLKSLKKELMRQLNDLKTEKQRRIDELEAENQRLRQKGEVNWPNRRLSAVVLTNPPMSLKGIITILFTSHADRKGIRR